MFKFHYDGYQSLLCSISKDPLEYWSKCISLDGSIKKIEDASLNGDKVIEIMGKTERSNSIDYIPTSLSCPADSKDFLQTKLPILVFVLKNLKLEGKIEFQLIDDQNFRRKFILITNTARNKIPKVTPTAVFLPFTLDDDWNLLEIDLQNISKEIFATNYVSLQRITLHPNFRYRRIYLLDHHYDNSESIKDIYQALLDINTLKNARQLTDKNCQTQSIFLNAIPGISGRKKRKKMPEVK